MTSPSPNAPSPHAASHPAGDAGAAPPHRPVSRRALLLASAAAGLVAGCSSTRTEAEPATTDEASGSGGSGPSSTSAEVGGGTGAGATALTVADFEALGTCTLLPEKTAGPFPLDEQFVRRDITEGYPGHPLRLGLRVVDPTCAPVAGAAVEVWHADATGDYSAFADGGGGKDEGTGSTFLRGTQVAGDDGIVEFLSLYPGWYRGRAVHIHLRVHVDDTTVLTSQLFFDEDHTAQVYADDPYAANGLPDTSNARDSIAGDPEGEGTLLHLSASPTDAGPRTLALLNLGIESAVPAR